MTLTASSKRLDRLATGTLGSVGRGMRAAAAASAAGERFVGDRTASEGSGTRAAASAAVRALLTEAAPGERPGAPSCVLLPRLRRVGAARGSAVANTGT